MTLIGITGGGIGHGKTTFVEYLLEASSDCRSEESSALVMAVANNLKQFQAAPASVAVSDINKWLRPLPEVLNAETHTTISFDRLAIAASAESTDPLYTKLFHYIEWAKLNSADAQQTITYENKETFRPLLQWLGGYVVLRISDSIWFDELIRRVRADPMPDLGIVSAIRFPSDERVTRAAGGRIIRIYRPEQRENQAQDITEREIASISVDSTVTNNGSLDQLRKCAQSLIRDIQSDNLAQTYETSRY